MAKVNFNAKTHYEYRSNFVILQNLFKQRDVKEPLDISDLIQCKRQGNLDFLQRTHIYWLQNYPGGDQNYPYNPEERRHEQVSSVDKKCARSAARATPAARTSSAAAGARRAPIKSAATTGARPTRPAGGAASAAVLQENTMLKETVAGLEKERDFYFSKLRDIELLVQQAIELDPELEKDEEGLVRQTQAILYSTEEGFEIPTETESGAQDDLETF
ncbi:hypothetical protein MMC25_000922 [Agyrium rufum]|nr:hypothetical protein [Agyrium rufum]